MWLTMGESREKKRATEGGRSRARLGDQLQAVWQVSSQPAPQVQRNPEWRDHASEKCYWDLAPRGPFLSPGCLRPPPPALSWVYLGFGNADLLSSKKFYVAVISLKNRDGHTGASRPGPALSTGEGVSCTLSPAKFLLQREG